MAGNSNSGRSRKPLGIHQEQGTDRQDRHGARIEQHFAHGRPECPDDLQGDGRKLWGQIVNQMPDRVLCEIDWASLAECCRWHTLAAEFSKMLMMETTDAGLMKRAIDAGKQFQFWVGQFGLTPVARAKLSSTAATNDSANPFEQLKQIKAG
jgi:phage terminase small subunit